LQNNENLILKKLLKVVANSSTFSYFFFTSWYTLSPDGPGISSRATDPSLEGFVVLTLTVTYGERLANL
jgi:hypothetical protein